MKESKDDTGIAAHPNEGKHLRLVPSEKRESLLPDPKLKALIEEMKGKQRVKLRVDEGPEGA